MTTVTTSPQEAMRAPVSLRRHTVMPPLCAIVILSIIALARPDAVAWRIYAGLSPALATPDFARNLVSVLGLWALVAAGSGLILTLARSDLTWATAGLWWALTMAGLFAALSAAMWWYIEDDAGISFTYARNFAMGHGLVIHPAESPVEGYSNPLFVLLLTLAHLAGGDIVLAAKALGLAAGIATVLILWQPLKDKHPVSWLAMPIIASNAAAIVWFNSGLETGLHGLLLTLCAILLARTLACDRGYAALGVTLALLVLSRPEGPIFTVAAAALLAPRAWRQRRTLTPTVLMLLVPTGAWVALTLFRLLYFGDPLPNTYYAKAANANTLRLLNPFSGGWTYVQNALHATGWSLAILPILLMCLYRRGWTPLASAASAILAAQLFFVVSVGGDWMAEFRFIAPIIPVLSLLIGLGLAGLVEMLQLPNRPVRWLGSICALAVLIATVPQLQRLMVFASNPTTPLDVVGRIGQQFNDLARQMNIQNPTLLAHDAGGTTYLARIHLIDLAGLCDKTLARHRRDPEIFRRYVFEEHRPTFIYSAKVFADAVRLDSFPEFHRDYVRLPPATSVELEGYIRHVRREYLPLLATQSAGSHE